MDLTLRRNLLRAFILCLSFSAVLGIVAIFGGPSSGVTGKLIMGPAYAAAAFLCGMPCAAFLQRNPHHPAGVAGIAVSVLLGAMMIVALLLDITSYGYWKTCGYFAVVAISLAHALRLWTPTLSKEYRWAQAAGSILTAVLALLVLGLMGGMTVGYTGLARLIGALIVALALLSILVPLFARLSPNHGKPLPSNAEQTGPLTLYCVSDSIYRDSAGIYYKVHRLNITGN
jgi:hypothetical protein